MRLGSCAYNLEIATTTKNTTEYLAKHFFFHSMICFPKEVVLSVAK